MKTMLVALAATLTVAYAPHARAQVESSPVLDPNVPLPQTITFPAEVRGKGQPTTEQMSFRIEDFRRGKNGTLCVVGTLSGGAGEHVIPATPLSLPATAAGGHPRASDCNVNGDDGEEHGSLLQPGARVSPAVAAAELGLSLKQAPFRGNVGGVIVPTQGACTILNLFLGRIQLNLLGLVVDTHNTIHISITALPGGGLLGSLLSGLLC